MKRSILPRCETSNIHYFVTKHKKMNFVKDNSFFPLKNFAMLKQFKFSASNFLFLLATVSCVSGQQYKNQEFENSKIYPSIACTADTNTTYALFLPPQYEKRCV